jgi:NDP-sugar pyrophosphorylase family protein
MNGDLLTKVNFKQLLDFHTASKAPATLCIRGHDFQIPFGVAKFDDYKLSALTEKPVETVFVNAGIYALNPEVLTLIPKDHFYDMPDLFSDLLSKDKTPGVFPVREYWLDIGQMKEYEKADEVYAEIFESN